MLEKILTQKDCADCRFCCTFDRDDIWEVPLIDDDLARLIPGKYNLDIGYEFVNGNRVFEISYDEKGESRCPAFRENGCGLLEDRPFDCKIWPFRAMKLGEFTVITVSPFCEKVNQLPLWELVKFVNEELAEKIKARMEKYPGQVKDYIFGYAILKVIN